MEKLRGEIIVALAEYSNDLFEGESNQRWKSESELADYLIKLMEVTNDD